MTSQQSTEITPKEGHDTTNDNNSIIPISDDNKSTGTGTNNVDDKNANKIQKLKKNVNTNDTSEFLRPIPNQVIENKFDDIIGSVIQVDNTCCFKKCKQKTNLMGVDCQFCKCKYCFKHSLPEVHGCGDAVKIDERKKFLHPIPEKTKRQQAELKKAHQTLNTKLKEMQISRLPKPKKTAVEGASKKSKTASGGRGPGSGTGDGTGTSGAGSSGTSSGGKKKKN